VENLAPSDAFQNFCAHFFSSGVLSLTKRLAPLHLSPRGADGCERGFFSCLFVLSPLFDALFGPLCFDLVCRFPPSPARPAVCSGSTIRARCVSTHALQKIHQLPRLDLYPSFSMQQFFARSCGPTTWPHLFFSPFLLPWGLVFDLYPNSSCIWCLRNYNYRLPFVWTPPLLGSRFTQVCSRCFLILSNTLWYQMVLASSQLRLKLGLLPRFGLTAAGTFLDVFFLTPSLSCVPPSFELNTAPVLLSGYFSFMLFFTPGWFTAFFPEPSSIDQPAWRCVAEPRAHGPYAVALLLSFPEPLLPIFFPSETVFMLSQRRPLILYVSGGTDKLSLPPLPYMDRFPRPPFRAPYEDLA